MRNPDRSIGLSILLLLTLCGTAAAEQRSSVLLVTLDTTRADHIGAYGSETAKTPHLDALAAKGILYRRAISPAPLTLPAHATLLTGLDPPQHGLSDNGVGALPADLPTLASVLAARGFATAAFIGSRVLDARFGLARGFDLYDDRLAAERSGEYGYAERRASAVTDSALAWLAGLGEGVPFFVWVHYYDPHSPYDPPNALAQNSLRQNYQGEIDEVDRQIGRLLDGLTARFPRLLVAVAGDHGEMLGEHGERTHGFFLYRAALEVPLILSGANLPQKGVVEETVGIRALPASILSLLGLDAESLGFGASLPALQTEPTAGTPRPVYSESRMPANTHGWSPLTAVTLGDWRWIRAPRPELYNLEDDPHESRNLQARRSAMASALETELADLEASFGTPPTADPIALDRQLARELHSLGYLSDLGTESAGTRALDPKDGIAAFARFEAARSAIADGRPVEAISELEDLVVEHPANIPFLVALGDARLAAGKGPEALEALRRAVALMPGRGLLRAQLADALFRLGQLNAAREEYETAIDLNPRFAGAWLRLAEIAHRRGRTEDERRLLQEALESGATSANLLTRLAQLEAAAGEEERAEELIKAALDLLPEFALAWWTWGEIAEGEADENSALARYRKAVECGENDPAAWMHLARLELRRGDMQAARARLEELAQRQGPHVAEARQLLEDLLRASATLPR